jgi:acetyl esterase
MSDEGVLTPEVEAWLASGPIGATPLHDADLSPEVLALARGPAGAPPTRHIDSITDDDVDGIPIRVYRNDPEPSGLIVYFHGGGYCLGSIALMDNVARELAHTGAAVVVSVEYRLAPEHPFPAGLDDCEMVTRWALAHAQQLGTQPDRVVVAGESAGGTMSAAVTLRMRGSSEVPLAGQVLMYPSTDGDCWDHPSREEFAGLVLDRENMDAFWRRYSGGRDISGDPFAAPLRAESLTGLPPALVILGGADLLRDEGRAYAARLREGGVDVDEVCYAGQPHGFVNFELPAASDAFARIGTWLRERFDRARAPEQAGTVG